MSKYLQISFPQREWPTIKGELATNGAYSTIRCCAELGKYKVGEAYETPWGDLVEITEVIRYNKPEDIPSWNSLDKGQKISVRKGAQYGNSEWDRIKFKKIG